MSDGSSTLAAGPGGLEAGVQVGDFRIERRLGAGGMGIVYQARQLSLNRLVALKVLGQALTRSAEVSRFQREAQAAARLKHPSIAQVYFIGQDKHVCYLAMELIDGVSLRRVLDQLEAAAIPATSLDSVVCEELAEEPKAKPIRFDLPTEAVVAPRDKAEQPAANENPYLSPQARELRTMPAHIRRVCEIIRDAALALAHAHEQRVVHRDIKPDNLLLGRDGRVHLIDFGVARFFEDQAVTYTGQLVGTPLYMSPEQVTGRGTIDARSDIYSLGLVLYELLTLRTPIEATNRETLLRTIVTKPLPPVSCAHQALPTEIERIVHRATQKDPDQRYISAADFVADLERFLAGKPVAAPAYHFRLDEREIIAARPGRVVLAAFLVFLSSSCSFVVAELLAIGGVLMSTTPLVSEITNDEVNYLIGIGAIAAVLLAASIPVGQGILAARPAARWVGATLAMIVVLVSLAGVFEALRYAILASRISSLENLPKETLEIFPDLSTENLSYARIWMIIWAGFFALASFAGCTIGSTIVWGVLSRATARWFRFAREIRMEHRQLKEQLAG